jgi:hypothetical protein
MDDGVICKDCKHSFRTFSNWMAHGSASFAYSCRKAYNPEHDKPDPVIGSTKVKAKYESCGVARIGHPNREDRCGEAGRFWEPKNKRDLFKFIKHVSV